MPFEFKQGERKHPREYGNSPAKALLEEIRSFTQQHRKHSLRRFAGLDGDEEQPTEKKEATSEECEACAKGECDKPEHLSEEDKSALEQMLEKDGGPDEAPSDEERP